MFVINHEVTEIARELTESPDIYQIMKAVVEDETNTLYKIALGVFKGEIRRMNIDDIKIYPCFHEHPPKPEKMEQKEQYFAKTGVLQSEIVIDSNGFLLDGFTSFLIAEKHGIECIPVRYGRRQIVKASHRPGGKLYEWELPGILIDRVSAGDKVLIHTQRGVRVVTVAAVEEYAGNEPEPLRMVIRVKRKAGYMEGSLMK